MKQNIRKQILIIMLLVLLIPAVLMPVQAAGEADLSNFTDLPAQNNWAFDGIQFCVEHGYMKGTNSTKFSPGGNLTRGQIVTILYRMEGQPQTEFTGRFKDVAEGKFYSLAVEWAAENEIVNGIDSSHFAPNQDITRQQIAAILYRYCGSPAVTLSLEDFPDSAACNAYAVDAMRWCVEAKLINGVAENGIAYLRPENNATRAQIATILMRLMNIVLYEVSLDAYEGLDDYMIHKRICTDCDAITAPFTNENGYLDHDASVIEASSQAVFKWAQELRNAGYIQNVWYHDETDTVTFHLNNNTISLYMPNVEDTLGNKDYSVASIFAFSDKEQKAINIGTSGSPVKSANLIKNKVDDYTNHFQLGNTATVREVAYFLQSLNDNHIRAIFWAGHGSGYNYGISDDGSINADCGFVLGEKVNTATENDSIFAEDFIYDPVNNQNPAIIKCGDNYCITYRFIEKYMEEVDGGLFFSVSCYGSIGGFMPDVILNKGFDAYVGSDGRLQQKYGAEFMQTVAEALVETNEFGEYTTIADAMAIAWKKHGTLDPFKSSLLLSENDATNSFTLLPSWKQAYAKVLRSKDSSYNFCLTHIDEDDIPELLVFQGFRHFDQVEVYTYYDGEACHVGDYPEYGELYFSYKNNVFYSRIMQQGIYESGYFGIENGNEVFLAEEGSIYDLYGLKPLSYFSGIACSNKNISAMLNDANSCFKKP